MSSIPMLRTARVPRRTLLLLGVAMLSLVLAIIVRMVSAPTVQPARPPAPVDLSSQAMVDTLQARLQNDPEETNTYAQLGLALLQRERETLDVSLYAQAASLFDEALARDPQQLDALVGQGILALALHDFAGALAWAEKALVLNPYRAETFGILVDAQVELGRYEEAAQTLQQMVDLRPDVHSYSRVAYVRELYGDIDGATQAMQAAVQASLPGSEHWLWTSTQVGHLYFSQGDVTQASTIYAQALAAKADYPFALAGAARVEAALGHTEEAIVRYTQLAERLPLPEFVIALGELYEATGQPVAARQQYELVEVMQTLNAAAGMNVDLEMALFTASHSEDPAAALEQARTAYAQRPTLYAADALAWALYQQGEFAEAWRYSQEALRLGTQDASLWFHAGMIAHRSGDADSAHTHLQKAVEINPYFSPLYATEARQQLAELDPQ